MQIETFLIVSDESQCNIFQISVDTGEVRALTINKGVLPLTTGLAFDAFRNYLYYFDKRNLVIKRTSFDGTVSTSLPNVTNATGKTSWCLRTLKWWQSIQSIMSKHCSNEFGSLLSEINNYRSSRSPESITPLKITLKIFAFIVLRHQSNVLQAEFCRASNTSLGGLYDD